MGRFGVYFHTLLYIGKPPETEIPSSHRESNFGHYRCIVSFFLFYTNLKSLFVLQNTHPTIGTYPPTWIPMPKGNDPSMWKPIPDWGNASSCHLTDIT